MHVQWTFYILSRVMITPLIKTFHWVFITFRVKPTLRTLDLDQVHTSLVDQMVKNPPIMQKTVVWLLGCKDSLENGMATHSSFLAWRIPRTEEPGDLCGHKESDVTEKISHTYSHSLTWRDGWMASPTQWSLSKLRALVMDRRPALLQFMGSQGQTRLSDWTELNWSFLSAWFWWAL